MVGVHRIANLVPPNSERHGYMRLADGEPGGGFLSVPYELGMPVGFLSDVDRAIAGLAYTEAGLRAERDGYSAVIVNAFGDYGLRMLRSASTIPVVGAGEASLHAALALGERPAILTVWPPQMAPAYESLLAGRDWEERFVGVRFVTADDELGEHLSHGGFGPELESDPAQLLDRIEDAARELIADHVDVIVAGCVCMVPACAELERRLGVPVVNPLLASHRRAQMLIGQGDSVGESPAGEDQVRTLTAMVRGGADAAPITSGVECGDTCAIAGLDDLAAAQALSVS